MNLVRAVNKSYGSPVDRVGEMSRWAVATVRPTPLTTGWSPLASTRSPQQEPSWPGIRAYFSSLLTYVRFNAALWAVSLGFAATKVWQWIQGNVLRREKVKGYEELLEDQAKEMLAQYGMLLDENAFDG